MRGSAHSRKLSAPGGFRAKHPDSAHTEFMSVCARLMRVPFGRQAVTFLKIIQAEPARGSYVNAAGTVLVNGRRAWR